jgi:hypothetical protein
VKAEILVKYKRSKFFRNCRPYTGLYALYGLHRDVTLTKTTLLLTWDTCYYFNQDCGDLFDRIGKSMLKRMYVWRSSV